jgi:hypothetical protein
LLKGERMKVKIEIACDNDAFAEDPAGEVSRILQQLAEDVTQACTSGSQDLFDINGNKVGKYRVVCGKD